MFNMGLRKKQGWFTGVTIWLILILSFSAYAETDNYSNADIHKKANYNNEYEKFLNQAYDTLLSVGTEEMRVEIPIVVKNDDEVREFARYVYQVYDLTGRVAVEKGVRSSAGENRIKIFLKLDNPYEIYNQQKEVEQLIINFVKGLEGVSDYDKVIQINNWIADGASYDYTLQHGSCYENLVGRVSTCNGFASAFYTVCSYAGVHCENVKGWVGDKYHIWNRVELNGEWKYVDVTWNNMAGENKWLLISREEMNEDRVEE